jgi:tetratricopeptide (TPR) repeat protein
VAKKKNPHHGRASAREGMDGIAPADVRWQNFCVCSLLVLLVVAVFGQTVGFGFVNYDDNFNVYENPVVENGLSLQGVGWAFAHAQVASWVPLTTLSHMLDCQLFGINAGGHHMVNVLLHAATVVLLFLVLRSMNGSLWRSAFVAAVFAVHPLRAESVAWVSERKDVLSGFFFMLTIGAYLRHVRHPSRAGYAVMILFFALGLLAKNTLVTLPFVLLLLDYWPLKRFSISDFQFPIFLRLVLEKIPLFLLSAVASVETALITGDIPASHQLPAWLRVENALTTYVTYICQMIFPAGLASPYPYPPNGASLRWAVLALVLLAAISAGVFVCRKKLPFLLMGWLWYLGMMLPLIGIMQISYYAHADRYTYLPEIGLVIAGTWTVAEWSAGWKNRRMVLGGLMAVIVGALMVCGYKQTSYWKDSETLWNRALTCTSGNSFASYNLANDLHNLGRLDEAIVYYQKTLKINPGDFQAECSLGNTLMEQGHTDQAIACFQKTLEIEPDYAQGHCNLGDALLQLGKTDEAVVHFQRAVEIQPDYAKAHYDLANVLFDQGHLDEAVGHYQKALETDSDFVEARFNLGNALLNLGRLDEAVAAYKKVLDLKPGYVGARNNLGAALMQAGRTKEAMDEYQMALQTQPENVDALNNLAWALATCPQASLRDGANAVALAQKAVRLSGGENPLMLRTLAAAYAETGQYSEAVETARHALRLAVAAGGVALAGSLQNEIEIYDADTPVRDLKP